MTLSQGQPNKNKISFSIINGRSGFFSIFSLYLMLLTRRHISSVFYLDTLLFPLRMCHTPVICYLLQEEFSFCPAELISSFSKLITLLQPLSYYFKFYYTSDLPSLRINYLRLGNMLISPLSPPQLIRQCPKKVGSKYLSGKNK